MVVTPYISITPAALNCTVPRMLLLEISYLRKQSWLVWKRKKKRNKWTQSQQRPKWHLLPSKVSESLRNHPSFLFLKSGCCFKIEMKISTPESFLQRLQCNSSMQKCASRLERRTKAALEWRGICFKLCWPDLTIICLQINSWPLAASAMKCRITTSSFQLGQTCPPLQE